MGFVGCMRVEIILAHEASVRRNHERVREVSSLPSSSAWSPRAGLQLLILTGNAQGLFAATGCNTGNEDHRWPL